MSYVRRITPYYKYTPDVVWGNAVCGQRTGQSRTANTIDCWPGIAHVVVDETMPCTFIFYVFVCLRYNTSKRKHMCVCVLYTAAPRDVSRVAPRRIGGTRTPTQSPRKTYVTCPRLPSYAQAPRGGKRILFRYLVGKIPIGKRQKKR